MKIYNRQDIEIADVLITKSAEHEEELMKSDFVKLSWRDAQKTILPVDAYIVYNNERYSLLEPYEPEQKSEAEWLYEPQFQHPKMYLSKVTFTRPTKDSDANDINLLDWPFTGDIFSLLWYFCEQINNAFGFTRRNNFSYEIIGDFNQNIVTATFNTQDILSALSNVANVCECEWHLDWTQKTLYFGRIMLMGKQIDPFTLSVGENIKIPSIRNSKEGYWNAFEPQGSTRNITRRAASGEFVQANVRLSLRNSTYPDGIVYTDGEGTVITKEAFEQSGVKPFVKSLIFEDIYPHLDLYAYKIRYRERYLLEDNDDPDSRIIDHYEKDEHGKEVPVYKKYAVWYMRLAWPEYTDATKKTVREWHDYEVRDMVLCDYVSNLEIWEDGGYRLYLYTTAEWPDIDPEEVNTCTLVIGEKEYSDCRIYGVSGQTATAAFTVGETYATAQECRNAEETQEIVAALTEDSTIEVKGEVVKKFNTENRISQIIDGKQLYGQFKVNTREGAFSSPLAGRGNGDNGNYGFGLIYLGLEGESYIRQANAEPTEEGDTGVVDMNGNRADVTEKDYEIVFQESGDYILPSTKEQLVIPKGDSYPSLTNNIVNLYNIVMDKSYEESAQSELENETKKYITKSLEDDNQYTFKLNPVEWERILREDALYNRDSRLFIGQQIRYINGENYTAENAFITRVMKIVTKLDYDFEQEVTIGNEVIKSSTQTLKEQVQTLVSGGAGGEGGISESAIRRVLENWVTPRFLSKINDDAANGLIGFIKGIWIKAKGLFGIDADGNGKFNKVDAQGDVSVGGNLGVKNIISALTGIFKTLKSDNFTDDTMSGTGYRLTSDDGTGHSQLVVDNIVARMKFIANILEVRKLTAMAGNYVFSPAASVIEEVDYFDEANDLIGYEYIRKPWVLRGMPNFIRRMVNNSAILDIFSTKRFVRVKNLGEDWDWNNVKYFRCWLKADDGSTQTINTWRTGMLARCQTFDASQIEGGTQEGTYSEAGQTWTGKDVKNKLYWRAVWATGNSVNYTKHSEVLKDGKLHNYIDLANDIWYNQQDVEVPLYYPNTSGTKCDIPSAGDHIVCYGDWKNTETSNFVTIETVGEDAPAIKEFMGVGYTDGQSINWNLDGKMKTRISPKVGDRFVAPEFIIEIDGQQYNLYTTLKADINGVDIRVGSLESGKNLISITEGWENNNGATTYIRYDKENLGVRTVDEWMYSPAIFLEKGKYYCFSAYMSEYAASTGNPGICYGPDKDPLSDLEDSEHGGTYYGKSFIQVNGDSIQINGETYNRYYFNVFVTAAMEDFYLCVYYDGNDMLYCPQLEMSEFPTPFVAKSKETSSQIRQTADTIDFSIRDDLYHTGIEINGKEKSIKLSAENVTVTDSFYAKRVITETDNAKTTVQSGNISMESKLNGTRIEFGIDTDGNAVLNYYDGNGNFVYGLGPTEIFRSASQAEEMRLTFYDISYGSTDCLSLTDDEIRYLYNYVFKNIRPNVTANIYQYFAKITAGLFAPGEYCKKDPDAETSADAETYNKKLFLYGFNKDDKLSNANLYNGIAVNALRLYGNTIHRIDWFDAETQTALLRYGWDLLLDSDVTSIEDIWNGKEYYKNSDLLFTLYDNGTIEYASYSGYTMINLVTSDEIHLIDPVYYFPLSIIGSGQVDVDSDKLYINKQKLKNIVGTL